METKEHANCNECLNDMCDEIYSDARREGRLEGARMMYIDVMFAGVDECLTRDQEVVIRGLVDGMEY